MSNTDTDAAGLDFVREIVTRDRATGRNGGRVHTRFRLNRTVIFI